jgi:hypothetical protein
MILGAAAWLGLILAVAAVFMMVPRSRNAWYHKEAGYDKPYGGLQREMGCTNAAKFTGLLFAAIFGTFGVAFSNVIFLALSGGCFVLAIAATGLAAENDRKDAAKDGIKVEYKANGGMAGYLATIVMVCIAAVLAAAVLITVGSLLIR